MADPTDSTQEEGATVPALRVTLIVMAGSSAELGATVRRDFELRGKIIREANIKAD